MFLFAILMCFVGLAALLAWYLIAYDKGEKEPVMALWWAAALGLAGALIAGYVEGLLIAENSLAPGAPRGSMLIAALSVGIIEEICKFLPLALLIYKRRFFNEHTDGVIYFALAGLGFGLPENLLYTLQFGTEAGQMRLLLTPLFHAAATGLIGYFLIQHKLAGQSAMKVVWPLAGVAVLHGLYNFGLVAGGNLLLLMALTITLGLSAGLFMAYLKATQLDQAAGLSAVGHNGFCRSCGTPNKRHHLYCVHCGLRA
jgi:RsiW-degrading membrane proteinase PrsW (M82 family)